MISTSPPWLTVIIPIKDERDNLSTLTERLVKVLDTAPASQDRSFEILYIDDGSTDGSSEYLDNLAGQFPSVRVLHFDRNYGQTAAFDAGFRHAGGDLIATLDGDLQLDPEDLLKLLPLIAHYDVVCGWRKERQ
ncbi:MAG TPA: glycosyltransferase, partial [Nitrospirales bacterium]|nr:glycosyltransferase [Nitrospirales bacterium]